MLDEFLLETTAIQTVKICRIQGPVRKSDLKPEVELLKRAISDTQDSIENELWRIIREITCRRIHRVESICSNSSCDSKTRKRQ